MGQVIVLSIPPLSKSFAKAHHMPRMPRTQADEMQWRLRSKYRKIWRDIVIANVYDAGGPPLEPFEHAEITGIRTSSEKPLDRCNTWYSFKCLIDALTPPKVVKRGRGLVYSGGVPVIIDDNPSVLVKEDYYTVKCDTKDEEHVWIEIREVS